MTVKNRGRRKTPNRTKRTTTGRRPSASRAALASDIRRVLAEHGIEGKLVELQVQPMAARAPRRRAARRGAAAAPAAPAAPAAAPCAPGEVRRVVCFFRKGTFVCEERCVPL